MCDLLHHLRQHLLVEHATAVAAAQECAWATTWQWALCPRHPYTWCCWSSYCTMSVVLGLSADVHQQARLLLLPDLSAKSGSPTPPNPSTPNKNYPEVLEKSKINYFFFFWGGGAKNFLFHLIRPR